MAATKMRSAYYPHSRVQSVNEMPSRTKQSMSAECDINNIMKKFKQTGQVDHLSANQQQYMDAPPYEDFADALTMVVEATGMFNELPAALRNRFHNQPGLFLDFIDDPKNTDELISMGILPAPEPTPADPKVQEPTPAAPEAAPDP